MKNVSKSNGKKTNGNQLLAIEQIKECIFFLTPWFFKYLLILMVIPAYIFLWQYLQIGNPIVLGAIVVALLKCN